MADYKYIPATKKTVYLDKQMFATIRRHLRDVGQAERCRLL